MFNSKQSRVDRWRVRGRAFVLAVLAISTLAILTLRTRSVSADVGFIKSWGGHGSGNGQFIEPFGVAVDGDGNLYVADSKNHRIEKFNQNGDFIRTWGAPGTSNGKFNTPRGVAADASSNVYVADTLNNRIQRFDRDGNFITTWGGPGAGTGQFNLLSGVAVDSAGTVYVADSGNNRIQKFDKNGNFIRTWGGTGSDNGKFQNPFGVAVDAAGQVVFVVDTSNRRIQKFDKDGNFLTKWGSQGSGKGQFDGPEGVAVDSTGSVYVADSFNHRIQKFDTNGVFLSSWASSDANDGNVTGIAADAAGHVYVADTGKDCVLKFGCEPAVLFFNFVTAWGSEGSDNGQVQAPRGITVDVGGAVYVADTGNNRIVKFDPQGNFQTQWGTPGLNNGQLGFPNGVAADPSTGNVYVADTFNNRIDEFSNTGAFIRKWGNVGGGQGQFENPSGVAVDTSGRVYVADTNNNRIQRFQNDGAFIQSWGFDQGSQDGQFNHPRGVAVSPTGFVYVADTGNHRVQKFSSNGVFVLKWGSQGSGNGQLESPAGVALDSTGHVYVIDTSNARVSKFDQDGNFLSSVGNQGSGNGQFLSPFGVAVNSAGDVYVADTAHHRLEKFNQRSQAPTANAGADQTMCVNGLTTVTLDGSGSMAGTCDTLEYQWSEGTTYLGSGAHLQISLPTGQHNITLGVTDCCNGSSTDTVTINLVSHATACNSGPHAVDDSMAVAENSGSNDLRVLTNDTDADNDSLVISSITQPTHGTASITNAGTTISYRPALNYSGSDTLTYAISDGHGGSSSAAVHISVAKKPESVSTTVPAGNKPAAVAVNPVTNKIYIANQDSGNVTVINGRDNSTVTVVAGSEPTAVAVNAVTNKIYVANRASNNVTVIDGRDNSTTTVASGGYPLSVAVNPVTNKTYVTSLFDNNVTVIDGIDNSTTTVAVERAPIAVAINPLTNKIYVANNGPNTVSVIDGSNNSTVSVPTALSPTALSVNSVTNKIYVADYDGTSVTVIDGSDNSASSFRTSSHPIAVAVNPATNKVYIGYQSNESVVTVIDGSNNSMVNVPSVSTTESVAINAFTNRIYVANPNTNTATVIEGADNSTRTVSCGSRPSAIAVNPVTNKIYVANSGSGNVTVIDGGGGPSATIGVGTTPNAVAVNPKTNKVYVSNSGTNNVTVISNNNSTSTVPAGLSPRAIAVNPITSKIYVANHDSDNVTVIDGVSDSATSVAAGTTPDALGINPLTNKIYISNLGSGNVTIIDGTNNSTTNVSVGPGPVALAVNPASNKIYVVLANSNVTMIDGSNNSTATIPVGVNATAIAVNSVTNRIYVANRGSNNVTVIEGANNAAVATVTTGSAPRDIAVNPLTNKIYVANENSNNLTVIDGNTNSTATVAAGIAPQAVSVNPATNEIYVANGGSNDITVIDGSSNSAVQESAGSFPAAIAVNSANGRVYALNQSSNNLTMITPANAAPVPLTTGITPLLNNLTGSPTATFSFTATSAFAPAAPPVRQIYYQTDTLTGSWLMALPQGTTGSGATAALAPGVHLIYAFAVDGQEATSVNTQPGSSPLVGEISAYSFMVTTPTKVTVSSNPNPSLIGQPVALFASIAAPSSASPSGGTVQFKEGGNNLGPAVPVSNGIASLVTSSLAVGAHTITADFSGNTILAAASSVNSAIQTVGDTASWTGNVGTNWNDDRNWSTGFAPTAQTNVIIPPLLVNNEPSIFADVTVNSLTLGPSRVLTISAARSLKVNGTADLNGFINGAGTLFVTGPTLTNNGPISVASVLMGGATQTVSGRGDFSGNNSFIVLSGAAVTLGNNFALANLYVSSGGSLNLAAHAISLSGGDAALQVDGSLMTAGSTIVYNGSSLQRTAPGNVTYENLTIANPAGVQLSGNTTITGELALTGGDLSTGVSTLSMSAGATSSGGGDVIGNLRRSGLVTADCASAPCNNTLSLGNPNNQITITGGAAPASILVTLVKSAPATFASAVRRTYTITTTGGSDITATLRLHYLDAELNGNIPESNLSLRRFNGTGWSPVARTQPVDVVNNWVESNAVTDFSQWTFSALAPTAAPATIEGRLADAARKPIEGAVVLLEGTRSRKSITDARGAYRFDGVETGQFYTVTPSQANFSFNPFNRSFSQTGNKTEASFTGTLLGDNANPLDTPEYFVRQQYVDVLGREPDEGGFNYWSDLILSCKEDAACLRSQRINVAAAFFIEQEFQQSGSFIYDMYVAALQRKPTFAEYLHAREQIVGGSSLETDKVSFAKSFVQLPEFREKYQSGTNAESFVDAMLQTVAASGVDLNNRRGELISIYHSTEDGGQKRAMVVRAIADDVTLRQAQYNAAFVLTEYFGYLRRDPDQAGFDFWMNVLSASDRGNYRGMVCSFITSAEYQQRFSSVVSHSNADCGQ